MSKHSELAKELYEKGYNCSQSVFAAFCDETGLDFDTALKISSSFGGGMGKLREVCGAVTGMFMVLGILEGYSDPLDQDAKGKHNELIYNMGNKFKDRYRSLLCRDLLEIIEKEKDNNEERPCSRFVEGAARMIDAYIEGQNI